MVGAVKKVSLANYRKAQKRGEIFAGTVTAEDGAVIEFHWREPTGRDLMTIGMIMPEGLDGKSNVGVQDIGTDAIDAVLDLCVRVITDSKGKAVYDSRNDIDGNVDDLNLAMSMFTVIMNHMGAAKKKRTRKV